MGAARTGRRKPQAPSSEGAPAIEPDEDDEDQADEDDEDQGDEDEEESAVAPSSGGPSGFRPLAGQDTAQNGAGIILGTLLYFVAVNYLRGGFPQVKQWAAAKFFNKTSGSPAGGTTKAPAPTNPAAPAAPSGMGLA